LGATIITVLVSFWLRISKTDWIAILLVIGIVWIAEFLNTALEVIVDIASPEKHPLAKVGKDVGAAAVLIAAIIAVLVGVLVLGVPFLEKLSGH
jgi:diacylglycerol kinase